MPIKHRILIVDDHEIVRMGLRSQLELLPDIELVGEGKSGRDAVLLSSQFAPDLIVIDLHMPGGSGIDAIEQIHNRSPSVRILVFTFQKAAEYVCAACRAGASGYVLKDEPTASVVAAIRTILSGRTAISPCIVDHVINLISDSGRKQVACSLWELLTHREREVLKLIAEGHSSKHIAKQVSRSHKTIEKHRANLMKKLDLHSVAGLTQFAIEHHLLATGE
jgi:two-component system, NarL family, response regulator NreC